MITWYGYLVLTGVNWSQHECPLSKEYTVKQDCMSLSTYYLKCGRHLARLRRRRRRCRCHRRRRRAYAPTSNTASHENHEKINSWVSFSFPYEYGAPLSGLLGLRSSAKYEPISAQGIRQFLEKRLSYRNTVYVFCFLDIVRYKILLQLNPTVKRRI